ncbi:putative inactive ATP-dependent zinc metalloprotease FTSHI 5, chloroplastic, variant 2 [Salvia divinorum]|uniref:Inactive ATP-dependent zinc metalloprotease FTSHI 5, chloroplastic, variant 2 n=1 Tax=Salvia divinorum TaxID=28513 RepID=A0ABD1HZI1_SALDI
MEQRGLSVLKLLTAALGAGRGLWHVVGDGQALFGCVEWIVGGVHAPVIIFVEDFDLFAGVRGKFLHTKKQDHEAFINQLLVELDGFEKQDGVVLMATTRNLKQVDEALQRPGRMDRIFHLQRPTQAERERILHIAARETMDEDLINFVDWRKVAEKTALLRPVELKLVPLSLEGSAFRRKCLDTDELLSYYSWFATFSPLVPRWVAKTKIVKRISKMMVNHLGLTLAKEDLQDVVDLMEPYGQINNGIELLSPPLDWTRETKFPHAVWAAGRGLMALLLPNFDVVDNLWLEPSSWEGIGCTKITKGRNDISINGNVETRAYLEKKLVFCFGSYVASQLLLPFGEENILSASELKEAQEIATRMVIQYGWGPDDSPTIYHHGTATTALSMGDTFEYEMAAKVEKIYNLAYDKAKVLLQKNCLVLEKIVHVRTKEVILRNQDIAAALSDFLSAHSIKNIVVGASSRGAIARAFRNGDVATFVGKLAPHFCSVYSVSKAKVNRIKSPTDPAPAHRDENTEYEPSSPSEMSIASTAPSPAYSMTSSHDSTPPIRAKALERLPAGNLSHCSTNHDSYPSNISYEFLDEPDASSKLETLAAYGQ